MVVDVRSAVASRAQVGTLPPIAPRGAWSQAVRTGLAVWLASRVSFYALGMVITSCVPAARSKDIERTGRGWPWQLYSNFDTGHFLRIATQGYFPHGPGAASPSLSPAFLPGYPMAARLLAHVFGLGRTTILDYFAALAVLSLLASATSAVLLHRLLSDLADSDQARTGVIVLLAGPYSVFLMASYSEGLFLTFALGAWLAGRRNCWLLAGGLAGLAALVRINGVFLAVALVMMWLTHRRQHPDERSKRAAASLLIPAAATLAYFGYLHQQTGRWTEWFEVQRIGWGRETVWPATALANSVRRVAVIPGLDQHYQNSCEILYAAVFVAAVAVLARQRAWPESTYVGLTAASLMTSHHYLSVPRTTLVCFPILLLVARILHRIPRSWLRWAVGPAGAALLTIDSTSYLCGWWAG